MGDRGLTAEDFRSLYDRLRRQGRASRDGRGTLGSLTRERVRAAATQVESGWSVSLAAQVEHEASADNPDPWVHRVDEPATGPAAPDGLDFALDTLSLHIHGNADSHIDALSHVVYDGTLYGDVTPEGWTTDEVGDLSIDAEGQGIVGPRRPQLNRQG